MCLANTNTTTNSTKNTTTTTKKINKKKITEPVYKKISKTKVDRKQIFKKIDRLIIFLDLLLTNCSFPSFFSSSFLFHGNGDTIRIRQEIKCLPYARFFFKCIPNLAISWISNAITYYLDWTVYLSRPMHLHIQTAINSLVNNLIQHKCLMFNNIPRWLFI